MIAALQMYDWPEVHGRNNTFWARVRAYLVNSGIDAPEHLSRPENLHAPWTQPDLILGQTCGLPLVLGLAGDATVLGRPCYGVPMATDGTYRSALVCRTDAPERLAEFRGTRAAVNDFQSQSGCNALANAVMDLSGNDPFFSQVVVSGAHRASAIAVAEGRADLAAIDAVAWAMFEEWEPEHFARLRVLSWTVETPILPYIQSSGQTHQADLVFLALRQAARQTGALEICLPVDVKPAKSADYQAIRDIADRTRGVRLAPGAPPLWSDT